MPLPLEAVPNFSEGRSVAVLEGLRAALARHGRVLDVHVDVDHHRSVFTLGGSSAQLVEALLAGVACARDGIDLRRHEGVHPRVGAADVVPIVAVWPEQREEAREAARTLAVRIGDELSLPVFLYGDLAPGIRPAHLRRGGLAELRRRIDAGEVVPDHGPRRLHPSAGCVVVGARPPLIAFNVDLATTELEVARAIAVAVRETGGGFPGVRALGLPLERRGLVQVSLNIEDWRAAPPVEIVERIRVEAAARGVALAGSELVGLIPEGAAAPGAAALGLESLEGRILEQRLLG